MFYSQFILAKKGPLGTIWIAAHLDRKLRRNQVTETNISMSVDSILFPEVPIALRLSGHLLLGVVRIYSRKVNYLFHDCSEALVKIKQAFHSEMVNLPPDAATAPFHSITLPETFDLDEFELLPDRESSFLANSSVDHHITSREQITLQDPLDDSVYLDSQFGLDERFADSDAARIGIDFDEDLLFEKPSCREPSPAPITLVEDVVLPTAADDALDLQIMPMTPTDDALDFQRMDYDDQHEPSTPALALEMTDLTENHEPSTYALGVIDTELEDRIEPSATVQTLEALGLTEPESEQPISKDPESSVENIQSPVELQEENLEKLTTAELPNRGVLTNEYVELQEDNLEKLTTAELPNREVLTNEYVHVHKELKPAQVSEDEEIKTFKEPLSLEKVQFCDESLEIEKLRSVVLLKEQKPDSVSDVQYHIVERDHIQEKENEAVAEIFDERMEEGIANITTDIEMQGVEKIQLIEETPITDYSSSFLPRPSPYSAPSTVSFPDDDDVLATILGRATPAIRTAPTPSETPAPKRRKSAPKPSARKRKPVLDNSMVLHGDVMRQQQENTSDIRRIRKKAPCTMHDIWAMQKEAHGQQAFYEPTFPGLSEEIQELYHRLFGLGGAKISPASCMAYVPNNEVANDAIVGRLEVESNFGDRNSHPERNADDAQVNITVTALPKLVEAASLDSDALHSEARINEPEHKQIPSNEPIYAEAVVYELQATCPVSVVESSGSEPVLDSPLVIKTETVPPTDTEQPSKDFGKDIVVQVDGEGRAKEEDIRAGVGFSSECTQLVEVVEEDTYKLENDRALSSETLSVDEPTKLISESQNIDSEIEKNFASGPTNQNTNEEASKYVQEDKEHKNPLQDTEETWELVDEDKQTDPPLQEAKGEVGFATEEASTECELPFHDTNKQTHLQMEVSQMQARKESQNSVQEFDKDAQEAMQVEDKEINQQECYKESQQEFDKEAHAVIQVETRESQPPQEAEKEKQVLVLEAEVSTLLQPKDKASTEVLEFLGDNDYADNDDFYDDGDDFDDMPENDPETNTHDKSGWSVRTRAVCQYLRSTFQVLETNSKNLEESGPVKLGIAHLLAGKTRKEAARMFFETLVLKTKDYVDVHQTKPYDDIKIYPQAKLMKLEI